MSDAKTGVDATGATITEGGNTAGNTGNGATGLPASPPPPPPPPAADPWHKGLDPIVLGRAQNKGWDVTDPVKAFVAATQAYDNVEKLVGAKPEQLVRWPDKPDSPEWADIKTRLGVPPEAAQYDLSGVKFSDGTGFGPEYTAKMQAEFHKLGIPKDQAIGIASMIARIAEEDSKVEDAGVNEARAAADARLKQNWGPLYEANRIVARLGMQASGLTAEEVDQMEGVLGKDRVMEHFRQVGASTQEGRWIAGGGGGGAVMTLQMAEAKLQDDYVRNPTFQKAVMDLGQNAPGYKDYQQLINFIAQAKAGASG